MSGMILRSVYLQDVIILTNLMSIKATREQNVKWRNNQFYFVMMIPYYV